MSTIAQYEQISLLNKAAAALIAIAATSYYNWNEYIQPKVDTIEQKKGELQKLKDEQKKLAKSLIDPVSLEEEIKTANREYKKMIELLPTEPAIEKVLNDFASLSRITEVEIKEFMPSASRKEKAQKDNSKDESKESSDTKSIFISVNLEGNFSSILSFLDMAMSLPRVLRIQDFEITDTGTNLNLSQRPRLKTEVDFVTYFQANKDRKSIEKPEDETKKKDSKKESREKDKSGLKSLSAKGKTGEPE